MYQKKERKKCGLPSVLKIKRDRERERIYVPEKRKKEKKIIFLQFLHTQKRVKQLNRKISILEASGIKLPIRKLIFAIT